MPFVVAAWRAHTHHRRTQRRIGHPSVAPLTTRFQLRASTDHSRGVVQTQRSDAAEKRRDETVGARTKSESKAVNENDEREAAELRWFMAEFGVRDCLLFDPNDFNYTRADWVRPLITPIGVCA